MRRPGDKTPETPGGKAAARLRMFQRARGSSDRAMAPAEKKIGPKPLTPKKGESPDENENRRSK